MALVFRGAHDRVAADAAAARTRIALRARVAVVAPRPIDRCAVPAGTGNRVAAVDRAGIAVAAVRVLVAPERRRRAQEKQRDRKR